MQSLFNALSNIWRFLTWCWEEGTRLIHKYYLILAGVGSMILGYVTPVLDWINVSLLFVWDCIRGIEFGEFDLTPSPLVADVLAIANTFTPLDELAAYAILYMSLLIGLAAYRFTCRWLPTIGGFSIGKGG